MRTIFIDNGTTGSIGMYDGDTGETRFILTPSVETQDYTKAKKRIRRIDTKALMEALGNLLGGKPSIVCLERPMINPTRFTASISAARSLEATLTVLECMGAPYRFVDSKEWQRGLLPSSGKKGTDSATLKKESLDIGLRLFPQHGELIRKHKDADGILGAYALREK